MFSTFPEISTAVSQYKQFDILLFLFHTLVSHFHTYPSSTSTHHTSIVAPSTPLPTTSSLFTSQRLLLHRKISFFIFSLKNIDVKRFLCFLVSLVISVSFCFSFREILCFSPLPKVSCFSVFVVHHSAKWYICLFALIIELSDY